MNRIFVSLLFCAIWCCAPLAASADIITIDTVPVGDPGNADDPSTGSKYGGVSYAFRMGATEVTNAQYVAFLNAKAQSDPLELYNDLMNGFARGGITRSGVSGSFTYAVKADMGNKPVNYVSWYSAIRFTNWLNNGQGNGDTESGAYTLLGGVLPTNRKTISRSSDAIWFLPNEDEWYKSAYYQPASKGGDVDNYWLYPTATNSEPSAAVANDAAGPTRGDIANPGENIANFGNNADWNGQDGNVTTVGSAGPLSRSYYGTYDQSGNLFEWNEDFSESKIQRVVRGGGFNVAPNLLKPYQWDHDASIGGLLIGFRVATIPEPSTLLLAATGLTALVGVAMAHRRRR